MSNSTRGVGLKQFKTEKEGQVAFFEKLGILEEVELADSTDGVYKGTLLEFKLVINDIKSVLFQTIKYLSNMRNKGKSIPENILLVDLNRYKAHLFNSNKYLKAIEIQYSGAASRNNNKNILELIDEKIIGYSSIHGINELSDILIKSKNRFVKVHIDLYDVVGWAERYYRETKNDKVSMFEELKNPTHFKDLLYGWKGKEDDFKLIMDCLNDIQHKKELGAFYTPPEYVKLGQKLVIKALEKKKKSDYIILDRCAGTGNLEDGLENIDCKYCFDKQEHKIISHCIVSTYELKEWIVLNHRFGSLVRLIIPPHEMISPLQVLVKGGDALSEEFIKGSLCQGDLFSGNKNNKEGQLKNYYNQIDQLNAYVEDKNCEVILYENPPFAESGAKFTVSGREKNNTGAKWKKSFVCKEMKKHIKGRSINDLANIFIWSGFHFYKPNYYILYSPIKYWKSQHLIQKEFIAGYLLNKKHFHINQSQALPLILWKNTDNPNLEEIKLPVYEILNSFGALPKKVNGDENLFINIKKVFKTIAGEFYEKAPDGKKTQNTVGTNGYFYNKKLHIAPVENNGIIGYLICQSFGFENPRLACNLTRLPMFNGHGFYLTKSNYFQKLPLFCLGKFPIEKEWTLNGILNKTSDGGNKYVKDNNFLKNCFIYTCLSYYNKCVSQEIRNKIYLNELCLDKDTIATNKLLEFELTNDEQELISQWNKILDIAKQKVEYNEKYKYGLYQIMKEINLSYRDDNNIIRYYYDDLNTEINTLKKTMLPDFYEKFIEPKLFKYELLK
jgi:hypothetical protein